MFPTQERGGVESRVHDAVKQNLGIRDALPQGISDEEHWKLFRKQAQASTLHVRRLAPEQDRVDEQRRMYLVDMREADGTSVVVMTYATRDSVGEPFEVELSRIVAVEEGDDSWLQEHAFRQNGPRNCLV